MRWISCAVAVLLLVNVGCSDKKGKVTGEGGKVLELTAPGNTTIKQAGKETITVKIKREKFDDPVTVELSNLPEGVTAKEKSMKIDKGSTEASFVLEATDKATVQKGHKVKVMASSGDMKVEKEFTVNVDEKK